MSSAPPDTAQEASFAERALGAAPSPLDRIDHLFQQPPRRLWWGVAAFAVLVVLGVVWTTVVQRVITVQSQAVILPPDGLFTVADPQTGQIEDISVQVGATVRAGQSLAVVHVPGRASQPIPSPFDARVVVENVRDREVVGSGTTLFVLAPAHEKLVAIGLFPAGGISGLQAGESASVAINGVPQDSYGRVRATVRSIGDIPLQPTRLAQLTGDPSLGNALAQQGPLYEVIFALEHANTPSGVAWTHGDGPAHPIPDGALAQVSVVVDKQALISNVF